MWNFKLHIVFVALSVLCVSLVGCKDQKSALIGEYTAGNIKKMSIIYNTFTAANQYKGPKDEAELKEWALEDGAKRKLKRISIDVAKFDDYLISERTGEKFEIRWGVDSRPMGPPRPVIFEATAFEGTRQVGLAGGGEVLDVDSDEEYDELMSGHYIPDDFTNYPNRKKKRKKKKK